MNDKLETLLNSLVRKYETPDFIPDDPVKFPHMFDNQNDQEISALISSSLAYGKREKILEDVGKILKIMEYNPYEFTKNFDFDRDIKLFEGFVHRYTSGFDVALLIYLLKQTLAEFNNLETLFMQGYSPNDNNVKPGLTYFINKLRSYLPDNIENLRGVYHLIPSPERGSACKRLNLFLKWMVRPGPVDLHLWQQISPDKLIIPLDTHVAKISRKLGLTYRKADDWITAEEITEQLKQFDSNDPVKYDFAIFGMGISKESDSYLKNIK